MGINPKHMSIIPQKIVFVALSTTKRQMLTQKNPSISGVFGRISALDPERGRISGNKKRVIEFDVQANYPTQKVPEKIGP